jgi:uncharacterized protein (TIGR02145 family)
MTDQDGNVYKTIKIGKQTWMAENLRTTKLSDGILINVITNERLWSINYKDAACCTYKNTLDKDSIETYGRLYNWYAAGRGKLAPQGWRIPTDYDFSVLRKYLGELAGGKMKAISTVYWNTPNKGATNECGFSALPGGYRMDDGTFREIGYVGRWWCSDSIANSYLYYKNFYQIENTSTVLGGLSTPGGTQGFSVRCIQNN